MSEDERVERATTPSHARPSRWRAIALGLVIASLALVAVLWLARSAIVTAIVAGSLEERGVRCEGLAITASGMLGALEIAPSTCEVAEGSIARVAWDAPLRAELETGSVSALRARSIAITRRASADDVSASGAAGVWMEAPRRVSGLVHFASRLSQIDSPAISVEQLAVTREGSDAEELSLEGLIAPARSAGTPVALEVRELSLAAGAGPFGVSATPRLRTVAVLADHAHGSLEGVVDASLELPVLGSIQLGAITGERRVRVSAEHLDATPEWHVEML
ncbi:MAG: hypothetical protein U0353_20115 [Sandaracinus sp.]